MEDNIQGIQGIQDLQGLQDLQGFQGLQGIQDLQGLQDLQGVQEVSYHYYFISNRKMYKSDIEINLELNTNFVEMTQEQIDFWEDNPDANIIEVMNCEMTPPVDELQLAKDAKIAEIAAYDVSDSVNGFYYAGNFMWLDKATRVGLVNTLNSAEAVGRDTINIWYNDEICVPLTVDDAKSLLSVLEIYAMDCYNVTASHKVAVSALESIQDVEDFDITADYPQMPMFNMEE